MSKHGYANVYLDRSSGKRFMGRVWLDRTSAENQIGTQIDAPSNQFVSASHLEHEGTAYVNWESEREKVAQRADDMITEEVR